MFIDRLEVHNDNYIMVKNATYLAHTHTTYSVMYQCANL